MTPSSSVHSDSREPGPIKLAVARDDALRDIDAMLQDGRQINELSVRTAEELDDANLRKREWVGGVSYGLAKITSSDTASIYTHVPIQEPSKASDPIETRTEQFHNEMTQRLERLMAVRKLVEGDSVAGFTGTPRRPPQPQPVADEALQEPASGVESVELNIVDDESGDTPTTATALPATEVISPVVPVSKPKPAPTSATPVRAKTPSKLSKTKVLLVQCSRNGTARQAICRFANQMNLWMEIVDYNPDQPHSIVDQLYNHRDAQFAIVYWGEPTGRELPGSAHPERYVGFALGFALGRLGRGRVFILGSTTTPPLPGFTRVLVAQLDSTGGWQIQLARRMKAAGVDIDLNKLT